MTSEEAAAVLAEIAYRLKHDPEQAFRARAYGNAAAVVSSLGILIGVEKYLPTRRALTTPANRGAAQQSSATSIE